MPLPFKAHTAKDKRTNLASQCKTTSTLPMMVIILSSQPILDHTVPFTMEPVLLGGWNKKQHTKTPKSIWHCHCHANHPSKSIHWHCPRWLPCETLGPQQMIQWKHLPQHYLPHLWLIHSHHVDNQLLFDQPMDINKPLAILRHKKTANLLWLMHVYQSPPK